MSADEKNTFYQKLKDSVLLPDEILIENEDLPSDEDGVTEQLCKLNSILLSNNSAKMLACCLMGRNLTEIHKGRKGKAFISFVKQHLPEESHTRGQIYFLMKLHEFAKMFPKLMYVSIGITTVKAKFKLVREQILNDREFWIHRPVRPH